MKQVDGHWALRRHPAQGRWAMLGLLALAACGGGGGSAPDNTAATETAQANGGGVVVAAQAIAIDAVPQDTQAFRLVVDARMADSGFVHDLAGGDPLYAWNPRDPKTALAPGMKVVFYGQGAGCSTDAANGPLSAGSDASFGTAASRSGVASTATGSSLRWSPQGALSACDDSAQTRSGPALIYLNPAATGGGIGMYTPSGPQSDGAAPFFTALGATGIDGAGTNANGLSSFVAFRLPWWRSDAVRPWLQQDGSSAGEARVVSTQRMASAETGGDAGSDTVQVKQQIVVALINTACQAAGSGASGPCQLQYLFNTASVRAGVSDWASFAPPAQGRVWFDAAQSAMPIVAGQIPDAGGLVSDPDSGLALYQSAGGPTQHQAFDSQNFDLRIGFGQLQNALRIVAARRLGVAVAALTDAQLSQVWSSRWNDPTAWVLVAPSVGQEVYNSAYATRRAWIGGGFSQLYVGPTR